VCFQGPGRLCDVSQDLLDLFAICLFVDLVTCLCQRVGGFYVCLLVRRTVPRLALASTFRVRG
jgi:hypothetical protein